MQLFKEIKHNKNILKYLAVTNRNTMSKQKQEIYGQLITKLENFFHIRVHYNVHKLVMRNPDSELRQC